MGRAAPARVLTPLSQRLKGSTMNKGIALLNNPYLIAVVTGLFVFGFARRLIGR